MQFFSQRNNTRKFMRLLSLFLIVLTALALQPLQQAVAQEGPAIPNFWDPQERFIKPNVKGMPRLRFLTTTDFPPFSFIDKDKRLTGFHVDLARAICAELELLPVCQIQALPFGELERELTSGGGEAVLAGMAISQSARQKLTFSRPYFRLPARFVAKSGSGVTEPLAVALAGKSVGIVDGTAHAAFARAKFGDMQLRLFDAEDSAMNALKKGEVATVFSDGLSLAFWMQRPNNSKDPCCEFIGGPYLSETYFGRGLSVTLAKGNMELEDAMNFALRSITDKGIFAELYLRYFPISLF